LLPVVQVAFALVVVQVPAAVMTVRVQGGAPPPFWKVTVALTTVTELALSQMKGDLPNELYALQ
jgi:hypothetical protein